MYLHLVCMFMHTLTLIWFHLDMNLIILNEIFMCIFDLFRSGFFYGTTFGPYSKDFEQLTSTQLGELEQQTGRKKLTHTYHCEETPLDYFFSPSRT